MKYLPSNSPEEAPTRYWGRPARSRLAIVLLSAAAAAFGGEPSAPTPAEAPLIGSMVVTATRLPAQPPASLASVADLGSMTVTARREPVPATADGSRVAQASSAPTPASALVVARH